MTATSDALVCGLPVVSMDDISVGFADVAITFIDNGLELSCMLVAGHVTRCGTALVYI